METEQLLQVISTLTVTLDALYRANAADELKACISKIGEAIGKLDINTKTDK